MALVTTSGHIRDFLLPKMNALPCHRTQMPRLGSHTPHEVYGQIGGVFLPVSCHTSLDVLR